MTQAEIYSLYYEAVSFNNDVFMIWLTVTFGAIIAIYVTSPHITKFLRYLIASLYTVSAFVLFGRLTYSLLQISQFREMALASGLEIPTVPIQTAIGLVYIALFLFGSLATLIFLSTYVREGTT